MRVAYIAGAYRAPTVNGIYLNIQKARAVAFEYWHRGYAVICPHTNTALMDGNDDSHVWIDGDIEILKRCDVIIMMAGWEYSDGARHEHDIAESLNKEIIYL